MHSHILIVDDQPDNRQTVRVFLETAGYRVSEAADGIEALRAAKATQPVLILLDLNMPCPNGLYPEEAQGRPGFKGSVIVLAAGASA